MCEPATIALTSLAISAAATGASLYGQQQQQQQTLKYQKNSVKAANEIAMQDFQDRTNAAQTNLMQTEQAASQRKEANNIETAKAKAHAAVAAGEGGTNGTSVDALLADYERQGAMNNAAIGENVAGARGQYMNDVKGIRAQSQQYLSGFNFAPVRGPDYIGAAANLASAGMQSYDRYQINKTPQPRTSTF